ncbi:MAG TPA: hypothetical protein DDX98_13875 [Bacteroidales bacterium]|nr:hypothetical protein [Bacteroidales bacterium]
MGGCQRQVGESERIIHSFEAHKFLQLIVMLRNAYHKQEKKSTKKFTNLLNYYSKTEKVGWRGKAEEIRFESSTQFC